MSINLQSAGPVGGLLPGHAHRSVPVWADSSKPCPWRRLCYGCVASRWRGTSFGDLLKAIYVGAGASATTALAIAAVPLGAAAKMEEDLFQMLAGAFDTLQAANCTLAGGHSSESVELALGFAVSGIVKREQVLSKGGMTPGLAVILTKPIGTGMKWAVYL